MVQKNTTNALFNVRQVPSLGFLNSQLDNVGEIENRGAEATLEGTIISGRISSGSFGGSLYTDFSEVKSLG